ncbi:Pycsar system effector family protein [Caballeronia sp. LZ019]|uniref:Pycsar system effector family protein n=1 Tax=Caballeronia sp. LZ019 TaxID=3038555 RepID=UPI0028543A0D|nr:Pycsar system effector family protein [Caballeronia sp. LZ019]MDR5809115.1 DUF5706 domain-containing protein [Caballeronia sp. LZ019]
MLQANAISQNEHAVEVGHGHSKYMAKNDQEERFEKLMSANLSRVVDFIKFAEAKNAALLTFCSAWLLGIANLLTSGKNLPEFLSNGLHLSFVFFAAGALSAVLSFLPKLSIRAFTKVPPSDKNLLFFGDIASTDIDAFAQRALEKYRPKADRAFTEEYLIDLSQQIAVNSRIAVRKMWHFSWGARWVMCALFFLVAPAVGEII